ncbi:MAG: adenylyltransferase/cytidyltransferase family protein [Alphaproteobacteria bacterium]|nr:adenylyltransferase/cytidyltransferase family protein [Alphaproteobacteria bacterium]
MIGFAVMRLQPFHKGHQKIIDLMLKENDKAILIIGSKDAQNEKNPYSFKERLTMVQQVYKNQIKKGKLIVMGINDIHNPPKWAQYIKTHLPLPATKYYCGTGQDAPLFKKEGFSTIIVNRHELKISGTDIRTKIKNNDTSWQEDIPQQIHNLILKQ